MADPAFAVARTRARARAWGAFPRSAWPPRSARVDEDGADAVAVAAARYGSARSSARPVGRELAVAAAVGSPLRFYVADGSAFAFAVTLARSVAWALAYLAALDRR